MDLALRPIGTVRSELRDADSAPRQGDEGAPPSTILLDDAVLMAARDLDPGQVVLVFTWFDRADRSVLEVQPRGDTTRPSTGVFDTRSPHRPNPIGLHRVTIEAIDGAELQVRDLEALDGTPVVDIKPVLGADTTDR